MPTTYLLPELLPLIMALEQPATQRRIVPLPSAAT
jgi:hypothetical protein